MKFQTIVADPPWSYHDKGAGGTGKSGAGFKYNTMSVKEIKDLPIPSITDKKAGACCFLWITVPLLDDGLGVLDAWGFKYKTSIFWHKLYVGRRMGMGHWYRGHVELVLFGTTGPIKSFRSSIKNIFAAPVRKHSQKPDEFFEQYVEPVAPRPRIELFATEERPGWKCWGLEAIRSSNYFDIFCDSP